MHWLFCEDEDMFYDGLTVLTVVSLRILMQMHFLLISICRDLKRRSS